MVLVLQWTNLICFAMVCWYLSSVITKSSKMEESLPFTFLNYDAFVFSVLLRFNG